MKLCLAVPLVVVFSGLLSQSSKSCEICAYSPLQECGEFDGHTATFVGGNCTMEQLKCYGHEVSRAHEGGCASSCNFICRKEELHPSCYAAGEYYCQDGENLDSCWSDDAIQMTLYRTCDVISMNCMYSKHVKAGGHLSFVKGGRCEIEYNPRNLYPGTILPKLPSSYKTHRDEEYLYWYDPATTNKGFYAAGMKSWNVTDTYRQYTEGSYSWGEIVANGSKWFSDNNTTYWIHRSNPAHKVKGLWESNGLTLYGHSNGYLWNWKQHSDEGFVDNRFYKLKSGSFGTTVTNVYENKTQTYAGSGVFWDFLGSHTKDIEWGDFSWLETLLTTTPTFPDEFAGEPSWLEALSTPTSAEEVDRVPSSYPDDKKCQEAFDCDSSLQHPVCGANGVTYASLCSFTKAFCQYKYYGGYYDPQEKFDLWSMDMYLYQRNGTCEEGDDEYIKRTTTPGYPTHPTHNISETESITTPHLTGYDETKYSYQTPYSLPRGMDVTTYSPYVSSEGRTEGRTFVPLMKVCNTYMNVDCSRFGFEEVCGDAGKRYDNVCYYFEEICNDHKGEREPKERGPRQCVGVSPYRAPTGIAETPNMDWHDKASLAAETNVRAIFFALAALVAVHTDFL
eukprot:TRINITY_DN11818_c0_g1_i2.p1 TRINITY_DN11818_c0_g1~~TRINITY_DN11818_c0_g1_i2.p1  ORF type:complete len:619 (-),score=39.28 TRINITY_DN11818_c0_g1_i2:249-2105(-)